MSPETPLSPISNHNTTNTQFFNDMYSNQTMEREIMKAKLGQLPPLPSNNKNSHIDGIEEVHLKTHQSSHEHNRPSSLAIRASKNNNKMSILDELEDPEVKTVPKFTYNQAIKSFDDTYNQELSPTPSPAKRSLNLPSNNSNSNSNFQSPKSAKSTNYMIVEKFVDTLSKSGSEITSVQTSPKMITGLQQDSTGYLNVNQNSNNNYVSSEGVNRTIEEIEEEEEDSNIVIQEGAENNTDPMTVSSERILATSAMSSNRETTSLKSGIRSPSAAKVRHG